MMDMPSTITRLSAARLPWTTRFMPVSGTEPPTFCDTPVTNTPGFMAAKLTKLRSVGSTSITSREAVCFWTTFWVSTIGLAPETVIVSSTEPTFMSALTVAVKAVVSSIPSRLTVLKPVSENVTV
jgi:hypothetical protein